MRGMPTAQRSPRALSPARKTALMPYPASASTQPNRTSAAIARSISSSAISGLVRGARHVSGTPALSRRSASPCPFLRQEQPQNEGEWNLASGEGERDEHLTV